MQSINIPSGVTSIGSSAFDGCTNLESVTFGENSVLESIGSSAFYGCSSLKSITIPSRVTSIGSFAFQSCTNIEEVHIDSVYHWLSLGLSDSRNHPLRESSSARLYVNGKLLTEVTALDFESGDDRIIKIPSNAFYRQSQLVSVIIPDFVTNIGSDAFYGCTSIYRVVVESATVLAGLTGTSISTMGGLLSAINNAGDRLYVLDSIDGSVPDYVKTNYTKLALTETVDGKTYYIYKKN